MSLLYGLISGFNDGGNLLGSFTSGRVISPRMGLLLLLAAPLGPIVAGTAVARTVGASIIDLRGQGEFGFELIVAAAILVVLFSWRLRLPTSVTLALVGAMLGWVATATVHNGVDWTGVARVAVGMPASVVAGGALAFLLYGVARRLLGRLPHARILELARLQVLAAVLQAFAYGANDMEKTIGLVAVARSFGASAQGLSFSDAVPLLAAFLSFAAGAVLGGSRIARRVGFGIFRVRPAQAFSGQLAAGSVVLALAGVGAPVSTTQTIGGALVGVGVVARASAVRWGVVRELLGSWLLTLPVALVLAAGLHAGVRALGGT